MNGILKRFGQESTWRGLVLVLTALGWTMKPELAEAIVAAGLSVVGLINILKAD